MQESCVWCLMSDVWCLLPITDIEIPCQMNEIIDLTWNLHVNKCTMISELLLLTCFSMSNDIYFNLISCLYLLGIIDMDFWLQLLVRRGSTLQFSARLTMSKKGLERIWQQSFTHINTWNEVTPPQGWHTRLVSVCIQVGSGAWGPRSKHM